MASGRTPRRSAWTCIAATWCPRACPRCRCPSSSFPSWLTGSEALRTHSSGKGFPHPRCHWTNRLTLPTLPYQRRHGRFGMRVWRSVALLCSLAVGCGGPLPEQAIQEDEQPQARSPGEEGDAAPEAQWGRPELGTASLVKDIFPPFDEGPPWYA